jgi:transposase
LVPSRKAIVKFQALGHTVRLMPPAYVKPYVKWQKNDATDAEAICEGGTRANMRFVDRRWKCRSLG